MLNYRNQSVSTKLKIHRKDGETQSYKNYRTIKIVRLKDVIIKDLIYDPCLKSHCLSTKTRKHKESQILKYYYNSVFVAPGVLATLWHFSFFLTF
jgi:hypothetical protein